MTASELAKELGVGRVTLFRLRKSYPDSAPATFDDVSKWRQLLEVSRAKEIGSHQAETSTGSTMAANATYIAARALKTQAQAEMAQIQLDATKRSVIRREEVASLFTTIAAIVKGRMLKLRADLPCALVGLNEAEIEKIVTEKIEHALTSLNIPPEFFQPKSMVG